MGILILLLIIIGSVHDFDLEAIGFSNRSFSVDSDHYTEQYDAYTLAAEYVVDNTTDNETMLPQTQDIWSMTFYFTHKVCVLFIVLDDSLLTLILCDVSENCESQGL